MAVNDSPNLMLALSRLMRFRGCISALPTAKPTSSAQTHRRSISGLPLRTCARGRGTHAQNAGISEHAQNSRFQCFALSMLHSKIPPFSSTETPNWIEFMNNKVRKSFRSSVLCLFVFH